MSQNTYLSLDIAKNDVVVLARDCKWLVMGHLTKALQNSFMVNEEIHRERCSAHL